MHAQKIRFKNKRSRLSQELNSGSFESNQGVSKQQERSRPAIGAQVQGKEMVLPLPQQNPLAAEANGRRIVRDEGRFNCALFTRPGR